MANSLNNDSKEILEKVKDELLQIEKKKKK